MKGQWHPKQRVFKRAAREGDDELVGKGNAKPWRGHRAGLAVIESVEVNDDVASFTITKAAKPVKPRLCVDFAEALGPVTKRTAKK
jgi:hypothetical protein